MSEEKVFDITLGPALDADLSDKAARNRQLIVNAYKALKSGGDVGAMGLFELVAPDVQFLEAPSLPYGGTFHGVEGARAGNEGVLRAWRVFHCEIQEVTAAGELVIAYMWLRGSPYGSDEVCEGPVTELFRCKDDKIVEWRPIYWDTHRVRQVFGLA